METQYAYSTAEAVFFVLLRQIQCQNMINYGLKDRVVLITGANNPQGIGATTAFAFAREGQRWFWYIRKCPDHLIGIKRIGMGQTDITRQMQGMQTS